MVNIYAIYILCYKKLKYMMEANTPREFRTLNVSN